MLLCLGAREILDRLAQVEQELSFRLERVVEVLETRQAIRERVSVARDRVDLQLQLVVLEREGVLLLGQRRVLLRELGVRSRELVDL